MANCIVCRGACCETFSIPLSFKEPKDDVSRWLRLHGNKNERHSLEFECRCTVLSPEGTCLIYEDRPNVCKVYPAGGRDCLSTLKARRTPEEIEKILNG